MLRQLREDMLSESVAAHGAQTEGERRRHLNRARFLVRAELAWQVFSAACAAGGGGVFTVLLMLEEPFPMVETTGTGAAADIALCFCSAPTTARQLCLRVSC
jgi:hypothetical protein